MHNVILKLHGNILVCKVSIKEWLDRLAVLEVPPPHPKGASWSPSFGAHPMGPLGYLYELSNGDILYCSALAVKINVACIWVLYFGRSQFLCIM